MAEVLPRVVRPETKLLFIENVGNLFCAAAFDLGENFQVALLSATEGEDKPVKYPLLFQEAKAVVITKTDLLPHISFDMPACLDCIRQVNAKIPVFQLSAHTGAGMPAWIDWVASTAAGT